MIFIILALVAISIPLVVGSLFVCVPKWWTKSVTPRIPNWATRERPVSIKTRERIFDVLVILVYPFIYGFMLLLWLVRGWFVVGLAVIEGVCPYNGSYRWRESLFEWFDTGNKPIQDVSSYEIVGD